MQILALAVYQSSYHAAGSKRLTTISLDEKQLAAGNHSTGCADTYQMELIWIVIGSKMIGLRGISWSSKFN
jgi:hypothetical protein